jgi:hypothetical protein
MFTFTHYYDDTMARYSFRTILTETEDGSWSFEIGALHKETNRASCVTNNNWVYHNVIEGFLEEDEYDFETDSPELENSWLDDLSEAQGTELQECVAFFIRKTESYFHALEDAMDEDREAGEWEELEGFWGTPYERAK